MKSHEKKKVKDKVEKEGEKQVKKEKKKKSKTSKNQKISWKEIKLSFYYVWNKFDRAKFIFLSLCCINLTYLVTQILNYILAKQSNNATLVNTITNHFAIIGLVNINFCYLYISKNYYIQKYIWHKSFLDVFKDGHKILGIFASLFISLHAILSLINGNVDFGNGISGSPDLSGLIGLPFMLAIPMLMTGEIRNQSYSLAYWIHMILLFLVLIFSCIHNIKTIYYLLPVIILMFIEICLFIIKKVCQDKKSK